MTQQIEPDSKLDDTGRKAFAAHESSAVASVFRDLAPKPSYNHGNAYSAAYGPFLPAMLSGCTLAGGSSFAGRKRRLQQKIRPNRPR